MIKIFEEYNNYYKEVSLSEANEGGTDTFIESINFEVQKIQNLVKSYNGYITKKNKNYIYIRNEKDCRRGLNELCIYKKNDEWFIIEQNYKKYFKCDQLEGLFKCLEDIL